MDGRKDGWMGGWIRMDGWLDRWMYKMTEEWRDGRIDD